MDIAEPSHDSGVELAKPSGMHKATLYDRVSDRTKVEMYQLYANGRTLESVGEVYTLSKQRIQQHLVDGNAQGLFTYPIPKPTPPDVETLLDVYRKELALPRVAKHFAMSGTWLKEWMAANGVSRSDLSRVGDEGRRERAFDEYMALAEALGSYPSTGVLQNDYRPLEGKIRRLWGDFRSFRQEFDIPEPALGNPNFREDIAAWTDRQKRLGVERRALALAAILNSLMTKGPQSFKELHENVAGSEVLVREVLVKAQDSGFIERTGSGKQLRYRALTSPDGALAQTVVPEIRVYKNRFSPLSLAAALPANPDARLKALERRLKGHADLCDLIALHAQADGMRCEDSDYIDMLIQGKMLIEVKTLDDDDVTQVRAAVGQLLYYRFVYRNQVRNPMLIAAFSSRPRLPTCDAVDFLGQCGIHTIWQCDGWLTATEAAIAALRLSPQKPS